jgi:uncharacterized phage protein gp47/JayE
VPYGLTNDGFVPKTFEVLVGEVTDALRDAYGASVNTSDKSTIGKLIRIILERVAELWELGQANYSAMDPDAAFGAALRALGAITGTLPVAASPSTVTLTATGTPLTSITIGSRASVTSTGAEFEAIEAGVIATATAWAISTGYVAGDRVRNASRIYLCTTAGTSAGAGGPTTTASAITDNTVVWRYLGEGTGYVDFDAECTEDGPTIATAGDITTIETPISGWSSVINILDADLGSAEETDEDFRIRRELELSRAGSSTADAIRADVLSVEGVTSCTVFVNDTDVTDGDGLTPHSIEVMVQGGDGPDIAEAIFNSVAAGIQLVGNALDETIIDSAGVAHLIEYSRPTEVPIYVDIFVTKDAATYPADGDDQIKDAIVAWGDSRGTGVDVRASALSAQAFQVTGVLDVTAVEIGLASNPTLSTTLPITTRQLAVYDTSRITVTSVNGTP